MFMHKCEVFIQYVKDLEQKQQFLFFFTNCQYAAIFCLLLRYNFQFLLLLKFSLFCTHILTHNAYPSEIFLFLSLSDIHHGVATLFYNSKKKKKKVWPLGHSYQHIQLQIYFCYSPAIFNYSCKEILHFYQVLVNVGFLKAQ